MFRILAASGGRASDRKAAVPAVAQRLGRKAGRSATAPSPNRKASVAPALGILLGAAILAIGCEPFADDIAAGEAPIFRDDERGPLPDPGSPARLQIAAWNIKYGAGRIPFWFDCWGDRVKLDAAEVEANLAGITGLLREVDPDVLIASEVEVNSRRSAYTDMVQVILRDTGLRYAAYFGHWNSRYVPSEGLGRMDLGLAVFSRYPIVSAEKLRLPDRTDLDAATALFYIHRVLGRVVIEPRPGERVAIYAVHTEAYDEDGTKQDQIRRIFEAVREEELPFVVGGDFNELPPTALQREDFLDERTTAVCSDDFAQPPYTPEVMQPYYDELVPWLSLDRYGETPEQQRRYFTHSVLGPDERNEAGVPGFWNRTLDYLFGSPGTRWIPERSDVLQQRGQAIAGTGRTLQADALRLSDHAPVIGTWEVTR